MRRVWFPPRRWNSCSWRNAEEFDLDGRREFADLVEEEGAAVRLLEAADPPGRRPGEGPLLVAEELALQEILVQGAAVHRDDRPGGAGAQVVDQPGQEFLSRPALPLEEDRGAAGGHPARHVDQALHLRAPVDDPVGRHPLVPQLLAEDFVLPEQRASLRNAVHEQQEFVEFHGFGDVVEGAGLHRIHGRLDRPVGRDDDDVDLRIDPLDRLEDLHPVHPRHLVIEEDQIIMPLPDSLRAPSRRFRPRRRCGPPSAENPGASPAAIWPSSTTRMLSFFMLFPSSSPSWRQRWPARFDGSRISKVVPPLPAQDTDLAPVPADDLMGEGQPEPQPLLLRRIFGIEDPLHLFGRHPAPRVGNADHRPFSRLLPDDKSMAPFPAIDSIAFLMKLRKACWSLSMSIGIRSASPPRSG